ncbi:MAG: aminopeptidase [Roseburia sp.]
MEKNLVCKMVKAMELQKGEVVLLNFWGDDTEIQDLYDFVGAVAAEGAMPMTLLHTNQYEKELIENMDEEVPEKWLEQFAVADVIIDIMEKPAGAPPTGLSKEKYPVFGAYLQKLFGVFSQKKKMIQVTMPSDTNAKFAGMEAEAYKERIKKALDIDYVMLKADCQKKINSFTGNVRTVRTGTDCVLTLDTTGREWIADAGDGALPCGEVYIAPVEEESNGNVYFETLAVEDVGVFHDVTVTIENGHLVSSTNEEFNAFLKELPENGDVVAELGIGMNPNVTGILGDSTLDENMIGTFHIAIGMNHLFGGKNVCPVHFDFVAKGIVE